jgi:hypothetical protein
MDISLRKTIGLTCATACAALSAPAHATVLYSSAGNYFIQTPLNDNIHLDNTGAIVTVELQGRVLGLDTLTPSYRESAARVARGTLNTIGATRIVAGLNQYAIEMTSTSQSNVHIGGRSTIHGDIKADMAPIWGDEATATQRLYLKDASVVSGNVIYSGYLRLQDQAVVAGNIESVMNGNLRVDIIGGFVSGSVELGGLDHHTVYMTGGAISGTLRGHPSFVQLDLRGGYIRQGLRSVGTIDGVIRGGYIDGGVSINNSVNGGTNLSVRGGRFETTAGDWLFSVSEDYADAVPATLSICGGQFGYSEPGTGLRVDGDTSLSVYGAGLSYAAGQLTGTLQDGSTINVPLSFGPSWSGTFTLHTVPAPARPTC